MNSNFDPKTCDGVLYAIIVEILNQLPFVTKKFKEVWTKFRKFLVLKNSGPRTSDIVLKVKAFRPIESCSSRHLAFGVRYDEFSF